MDPNNAGAPMLCAKNIVKSFGKVKVLKGVDLTVNKGDIIAIIGPSGSGKSTFLRCLNYLERIDGGEIAIDGTVIAESDGSRVSYMKEDALRVYTSKLGMVFQNFNLFPHLSVLDNITMAPRSVRGIEKDAAEERAFALLRKVGLQDKANNYPGELSGGQQQRVAIARALAMEPEILCFDEPTSALDPELTGEVLNTIKGIAKEGMTMVIVTHEMGFAREIADTVVFMDDGVIVDKGTPEYIFGNQQEERIRTFLAHMLQI